jgi:AraC family transcriptional regulator, regulatory protein of adaptative response / methylated-DNA-[protein]-cysteine methyltransferase
MLPDEETLYAAFLARDASLDGLVFACVTSTGVFCRLTCPARKAKRANCRFLPSVSACLADGFRPCKRCHPLEGQIRSPLAGSSSRRASKPRPEAIRHI